MIYNRFNNDKLLSALDGVKSYKDSQIHEKYGAEVDSNGIDPNWEIKTAEMYDDSVTVVIEKVKVKFFPAIAIIDKMNNKRIRQYTKKDLKKNKNKPLAYMSFPLISTVRKRAIVYGSYVCGGLCGSGGIFYLEKVNGKWKVVEYERRWIAFPT
jgi:predicted ATP-grasp superfamily ATP-dependent carboligase